MKKDVLLKAAEKGQTFQMMRCHCLGTGNQERNKKEYLKLVGQNETGFKINTTQQPERNQQTESSS
jgi:hypothetical protein